MSNKTHGDPMDNHLCRPIAKVRNTGPGREWWMGQLLEPIPGHPEEQWCMHIKTPYKSVVWGVNMADMLAYAVLAHIAHGGSINPNWLDHMADSYRKEAEDNHEQ